MRRAIDPAFVVLSHEQEIDMLARLCQPWSFVPLRWDCYRRCNSPGFCRNVLEGVVPTSRSSPVMQEPQQPVAGNNPHRAQLWRNAHARSFKKYRFVGLGKPWPLHDLHAKRGILSPSCIFACRWRKLRIRRISQFVYLHGVVVDS